MSGDRIALFLPAAPGLPWRWLRVAEGAVTARGEGVPAVDAGDECVAIAPADAVTLHHAELAARSQAQAAAAARLLVAEASVAPIADLHVAVGGEEDGAGRMIGVAARKRMDGWLAELAEAGIDPIAILPAPILLPRPDHGYVVGDFGDGARVYRGTSSGFAEDPVLSTLIVGDSSLEMLDRASLEASVAAALAEPPLDLRQGDFAPRRPNVIDWPRTRRLAWFAVAILGVSLLITVARVVRYSLSVDALETRTDMLARGALPPGETVNDAASQLTDLLARMRGGGAGFSRTAATAAAAVAMVPGTEITGMTFDPQGKMKVSVVTRTQGQIRDLQDRIAAAGFAVDPSPFSGSGDRFQGAFTVSVR